MKYDVVDNILPRTLEKNVQNLLNNFSLLIDNAINFGTHLINWDAQKQRSGDEHIPPLLFMRNLLELGDAISILIKHSSVDSCKPLLRSMLENYFGLEYLLEKESEKRALSYVVWHTHKNLNLYQKLSSSTESGKQFKREIAKDKLIKSSEGFMDNPNLSAYKANGDSLLKLAKYAPIENEYQAVKRVKKNPPWYNLFGGPNNIEQLAKYLNLHASYEILYRGLSGNVHATDVFLRKISARNDGMIDIIQIRYPEDAQSVTQNTTNILILTFLCFYKSRLPERNLEFQEWYSEFRIPNNKLAETQYLRME